MTRRKLFCVVATLAISACGGGGGGGEPSSDSGMGNANVPLAQAIANYVNRGPVVNATVTGWLLDAQNNTVNFTGSATISDSLPSVDMLKGTQVIRVTETVTGSISAGGTPLSISSSTNIYRDAQTMALLQVGDEGANSTWEVYPPYTYPVAVKPGDAGALATALIYYGPLPGSVVGTDALTYKVDPDTAASVMYRETYSAKDNRSQPVAETEDSYRVDVQGAMSLAEEQSDLRAVDGTVVMHTVVTVHP